MMLTVRPLVSALLFKSGSVGGVFELEQGFEGGIFPGYQPQRNFLSTHVATLPCTVGFTIPRDSPRRVSSKMHLMYTLDTDGKRIYSLNKADSILDSRKRKTS